MSVKKKIFIIFAFIFAFVFVSISILNSAGFAKVKNFLTAAVSRTEVVVPETVVIQPGGLPGIPVLPPGPAEPEVPTQEVPETPEVPDISETPEVSETPAEQGEPQVPQTPTGPSHDLVPQEPGKPQEEKPVAPLSGWSFLAFKKAYDVLFERIGDLTYCIILSVIAGAGALIALLLF